MGRVSGTPPNSETRVAGYLGRPLGRGARGTSSAGPRVGRLAGGAGRCLPLAVLPPPLPGLSWAPSPFRVSIRAAFSRDPHGAQLTGRVVYGPSSPRSRRPPATRLPRCPPARPRVRLSARPSVSAFADSGPERSGPRAGRPERSEGLRAVRSRDGARAAVVRGRGRLRRRAAGFVAAEAPRPSWAVSRALPGGGCGPRAAGVEEKDARPPAPLGRPPQSMTPAGRRRAL